MIDIITTLITNLFRTFIIKKFMSIFFSTEVEKFKNGKLLYILFFAVTSFIHLIFHFPPMNILANIIMTYIISELYEGEKKKKALVTMLIYGINMICDVFSVYLFSNYSVGEEYNQVSAYATVLLISICEFVIERSAVKKKYASFTPPYWNIMVLIPALSIVILFVLLMNNLNNRPILITVSAGILVINMLIFYLYNALLDTYLKLEEKNFFERRMESYANQLDILMKSEEKIRALRHDMKHHLNELAIMARRKENQNIINYIKNMQEFMTNTKEYLNSGNQEIDSVLNYMLNCAKEKLFKVEYKINIPNEMNIPLFDLNIILGNLLENAIQAAENSNEKWLLLMVYYKKGILFIETKNSFTHDLIKKEGRYLTTKKDIEEHGIGLQNVKKVVNSYHGSMEVSNKSSIFTVKIMLYTTSSKKK